MICFLAVITDRADIQHIILDQGQQKAKYWKLKHDCREGHLNCLNYPKKMMNTRLFWSPVFLGVRNCRKNGYGNFSTFVIPNFRFIKLFVRSPLLIIVELHTQYLSMFIRVLLMPFCHQRLLPGWKKHRFVADVSINIGSDFGQVFWPTICTQVLGRFNCHVFLKLLFTVVDSRIFVCGVFVCGG